MKKMIILNLFILISFTSLCQGTTHKFYYLVGNAEVSGYTLQSQECEITLDSSKDIVGAPVMVYFVQNKDLYIGGIMENGKGEKTKIKNITTSTSTVNGIVVTTMVIEGESFSKSIKTSSGYILKNDGLETVFYDGSSEIWKIARKKG